MIGREAGSLDVDKWFVGNTSFDSGEATLVVFWEIWCPHCKREMPELVKMWCEELLLGPAVGSVFVKMLPVAVSGGPRILSSDWPVGSGTKLVLNKTLEMGAVLVSKDFIQKNMCEYPPSLWDTISPDAKDVVLTWYNAMVALGFNPFLDRVR